MPEYINIDGKRVKLEQITVLVDAVVDRICSLVPAEKQDEANKLREEVGDLIAEALGKATALSAHVAGKLMEQVDNHEDRIEALEQRDS